LPGSPLSSAILWARPDSLYIRARAGLWLGGVCELLFLFLFVVLFFLNLFVYFNSLWGVFFFYVVKFSGPCFF
ncbi:hypothetical protein QN365_23915, partial [Pseudomonas sp. RTI1]|uniref:hypothetical protein n=1 Tax=Pseudomonas sp. RTI1 TaxID=3048636 RepID=UPI002B2382EA